MAVLRAFISFSIVAVLAFGFFMTKRFNDDLNQLQTLDVQTDCLGQAYRIANEWDRATAVGVCQQKAGAF